MKLLKIINRIKTKLLKLLTHFAVTGIHFPLPFPRQPPKLMPLDMDCALVSRARGVIGMVSTILFDNPWAVAYALLEVLFVIGLFFEHAVRALI